MGIMAHIIYVTAQGQMSLMAKTGTSIPGILCPLYHITLDKYIVPSFSQDIVEPVTAYTVSEYLWVSSVVCRLDKMILI